MAAYLMRTMQIYVNHFDITFAYVRLGARGKKKFKVKGVLINATTTRRKKYKQKYTGETVKLNFSH